jgi:SsrA-binding protein
MAGGRTPEIKNKKAYFDYEILEKYEAGIELKGTCLLYTSPSPRD